MNFLCHKNFNPHAARVLAAFDPEAVIDPFPYPPNTADHEWLTVVGKSNPKPVILSADDGNLGNAVQRKYVKQSGCSFVYLTGAWADFAWSLYVSKLIKAWPDIKDAVKTAKGQSLIEVTASGKVRVSTF